MTWNIKIALCLAMTRTALLLRWRCTHGRWMALLPVTPRQTKAGRQATRQWHIIREQEGGRQGRDCSSLYPSLLLLRRLLLPYKASTGCYQWRPVAGCWQAESISWLQPSRPRQSVDEAWRVFVSQPVYCWLLTSGGYFWQIFISIFMEGLWSLPDLHWGMWWSKGKLNSEEYDGIMMLLEEQLTFPSHIKQINLSWECNREMAQFTLPHSHNEFSISWQNKIETVFTIVLIMRQYNFTTLSNHVWVKNEIVSKQLHQSEYYNCDNQSGNVNQLQPIYRNSVSSHYWSKLKLVVSSGTYH